MKIPNTTEFDPRTLGEFLAVDQPLPLGFQLPMGKFLPSFALLTFQLDCLRTSCHFLSFRFFFNPHHESFHVWFEAELWQVLCVASKTGHLAITEQATEKSQDVFFQGLTLDSRFNEVVPFISDPRLVPKCTNKQCPSLVCYLVLPSGKLT